jgi:hypothetical protein
LGGWMDAPSRVRYQLMSSPGRRGARSMVRGAEDFESIARTGWRRRPACSSWRPWRCWGPSPCSSCAAAGSGPGRSGWGRPPRRLACCCWASSPCSCGCSCGPWLVGLSLCVCGWGAAAGTKSVGRRRWGDDGPIGDDRLVLRRMGGRRRCKHTPAAVDATTTVGIGVRFVPAFDHMWGSPPIPPPSRMHAGSGSSNGGGSEGRGPLLKRCKVIRLLPDGLKKASSSSHVPKKAFDDDDASSWAVCVCVGSRKARSLSSCVGGVVG